MISSVLLAFGTLFPIVNPISTTFVFDSLTSSFKIDKKIHMAYVAAVTASIGLIVFLALGNYILNFFGVTIYAFRVAGGLYLGKIAFDMLSQNFYKTAEPRENHDSIAIVPLGIPLLAGPGAMAAVLVLNEDASFTSFLAVLFAILIIGLISFLMFKYSHHVANFTGKTGAKVVERIMGLIVLVIAAQFLFNGISGYLTSLGIM